MKRPPIEEIERELDEQYDAPGSLGFPAATERTLRGLIAYVRELEAKVERLKQKPRTCTKKRVTSRRLKTMGWTMTMTKDWAAEIDKFAHDITGYDPAMIADSDGDWVYRDDVLALIRRAEKFAWNAAIEAAVKLAEEHAHGSNVLLAISLRALARKEGDK